MRILLYTSWLLLMLSLFHIFTVSFVSGLCLNDQQSLLLQLKNTLSFDLSVSTKLVRWNPSVDCCSWSGVACDGSGRVITLELDHESIAGGIENSTSLFGFRNLQKLNLARNHFPGVRIPTGLRNLTRLNYLNLSNAGFVGQIPVELSEMRSLISLDLSSQFQGVVRLKLENPNLQMLVRNLTGLRELYLDGANISTQGSEWWQDLSSSLPDLRNLSLRDCGLSGALISSLTQLKSLTMLRLDRNNLSATNPDFLANFQNLTILSLSLCSLEGYFLENIFQLPTLKYLNLSYNPLPHRTIPDFPISGSFTTILRSYTNLSGSIPDSIGNLRMLSHIDLSNCNFSGMVPSTIGNLMELVRLDFSVNFFTGSIPVFPKSKKLAYIDFSRNSLNGSLSSTHFDGLSNLSYLNLGNNLLSGSIPSSLFSLPALQKLLLYNNKFSGQVNASLTLNASSLDILDLRSNQLEGAIPESFFKLERLNVLSLSSNFFNGTMQLEKIQGLRNLTRLDLSYNKLSVSVSSNNSEIFQFPQLRRLTLASCNLSAFPNLRNQIKMRYLDLSNNKLTSQTMDFSCNNFQGSIPNTIGELSSLYALNLSHNSFSGSIPRSIGNLTHLESLDLSVNELTGEIPQVLTSLTFLTFLNLSYNKLVGRIPTGSQFQTFSPESYVSNVGLCGFPLNISCDFNQPERECGQERESSVRNEIIIGAAVGFFVGVGVVYLPLFFSRRWSEWSNNLVNKFVVMIQNWYGL